MDLILDRRAFIGLAGALPLLKPTFAASTRDPYVVLDEYVDSIIWHLWDDPRNPAPTGPLYVTGIQPWDGHGYPIRLTKCGWRVEDRQHFFGFYDFEWVNFRRELPDRFWEIPGHPERYPNVHSFIREQRFGESPAVMRERMEFNRHHEAKAQKAIRSIEREPRP